MREPAKDQIRLQHILEAIRRIKRYSEGKSFTDFVDDDMMYYAVVKNIESSVTPSTFAFTFLFATDNLQSLCLLQIIVILNCTDL